MSAIITGLIDFDDVKKGDLFNVSFDITGIDLTGKTLLMQVKKTPDDVSVLDFNESDGSLTKTVVSSTKTSVVLNKSSVLMKVVPVSHYRHGIVMFTVADDEQTIVEGSFTVVDKIPVKPTPTV